MNKIIIIIMITWDKSELYKIDKHGHEVIIIIITTTMSKSLIINL